MKPFTDTINAMRFGTLTDDLTTALAELTQRCLNTQRSGTLTLKLTLKPGKAGQIEVIDDVTLKMPKEEKGTSLMFATPEGNLQREDPRQQELSGLRAVDTSTGEIKTVGSRQ